MEPGGCQGSGMHARRRCCEAADGTRRAGNGRGSLLEPAVLAALARSEAHGYDLIRTVEELTGGSVIPDAGGLYRMLRRLEGDGLVSSTWEGGDAGPQRREYTLTDDGRALLSHWLQHLTERRVALDALIKAVERSG
ncbi:MAG: PadR family transcriptional regulator [Coriobacteriia bacterium]